MQEEYDFTNATRGKFYHMDADLIPPVHLDPAVLDYFAERANARGTTLSALLNDLLKADIALIDAAK